MKHRWSQVGDGLWECNECGCEAAGYCPEDIVGEDCPGKDENEDPGSLGDYLSLSTDEKMKLFEKSKAKKPCLDPEKMHGYCDQFGGSDYD